MDELEQRLRTALADDALQVLPRPDALSTIRAGVRRRRRRTRVVTAASAMAAAAIAVAAAVTVPAMLDHGARGGKPPVTPLSGSWRVAETVPLPSTAQNVTALSATATVVWVGAPGHLLRIDTTSGAVTTYDEPGTPLALAATPRVLWVAARGGSGCLLEERNAISGQRLMLHQVACRAGAALAVTANGPDAWLVVGGPSHVSLGLYAAGRSRPVRTTTVTGSSTGVHPLAIAGAHVFVLTRTPATLRVTRLAQDLRGTPVSADAPAGVIGMAYGTHRLILATGAGESWVDPQTMQVRHLADDATRDLTTGNSLLWSVVGREPTTLVVRDPVTARRIGAVVVAGTVSHVLAIDTDLWAVASGDDNRTAVLRLTPVGGK